MLHDVFIVINYCSDMFRLQLSAIFRELTSISTCAADMSTDVGEILHINVGILLKLVCGCVSGLRAAAAARKPDKQSSAPHQTDNLKTKAPNTTGSNHLYNTLELLMMGLMVPETC